MKCRTQSLPRRAAFTLVELLVALSLAVVITALILATFAIINTARRGQAERAVCQDTAGRLLEQLARDLEGTFLFPKDKATDFRLCRGVAASNAVLELAFARVSAAPGEPDLRWATVARVTYRLVEADSSNLTLYCLSRLLAGPGAIQPPVTNHIFEGLESFDIHLYDGTEWKEEWATGNKTSNAVPQAARLTVTLQRGTARHTVTEDVIIPVGAKFKPPKSDKGKNIRDIQ